MRTALWTTANKRQIRVCDMTTSHLRNTIAMMDRELGAHYRTAERNAVPIYHDMKAELAEREKTPMESSTGTTRAIIEAQRAGFIAGAQAAAKGQWTAKKQLTAIEMSETIFPMHELRPRVIALELPARPPFPGQRPHFVRYVGEKKPYIEYRVVNGMIESRCPVVRSDAPENVQRWGQQWRKSHLTPAALKDLDSLFVTPNEVVEVTA